MVERFEEAMLPHLAAAYNLARWLTRNGPDAEDLVQDAYLRALKAFDGFRGDNGRAWLLRIVRNTCYTWLQENREHELTAAFDEEVHATEDGSTNPETLLLRSADKQYLNEALERLPLEFREVIVLVSGLIPGSRGARKTSCWRKKSCPATCARSWPII